MTGLGQIHSIAREPDGTARSARILVLYRGYSRLLIRTVASATRFDSISDFRYALGS